MLEFSWTKKLLFLQKCHAWCDDRTFGATRQAIVSTGWLRIYSNPHRTLSFHRFVLFYLSLQIIMADLFSHSREHWRYKIEHAKIRPGKSGSQKPIMWCCIIVKWIYGNAPVLLDTWWHRPIFQGKNQYLRIRKASYSFPGKYFRRMSDFFPISLAQGRNKPLILIDTYENNFVMWILALPMIR